MNDLWVFGYGSLMWRPGFDYEEVSHAKLFGLHRRLCIYSHFHRGTPERPGLVLGLDKGGSCAGMAFRVGGDKREKTIAYLRDREMINGVYTESFRKVYLAGGAQVSALCYSAVRDHVQYAPRMRHEEMLKWVKGAKGKSGPNEEYVISTADKILQMGAKDKALEKLSNALRS